MFAGLFRNTLKNQAQIPIINRTGGKKKEQILS